MASGAYSFIDIAVLDEVRERFASGEALAILSTKLDEVIWANGPGAEIFGYPDIEAIMGASARLGFAARRQIAATRGFPDIGKDRAVLVRISSGVTSRAVAFLASSIALPDGEKAILLAAPAADAGSRDPRETASRAIAGFTEAGYFAALIDGKGEIAASVPGFAELGISDETLRSLVEGVGGERGRVLKRLIPAGSALYPAGFARLTDDPARHLLLVVEDDQSVAEAEEPVGAARAQPAEDRPADETSATAHVEQDNHPAPQEEAAPVAEEQSSCGDVDGWYFNQHEPAPPADDAQLVASPESGPEPRPAPPERPQGPVRFIWKTDAEGRFSIISDEFAAAVGGNAADVIGRRFRDVANAFGLDPNGEIAGLLERRDTWSGRSVLWPIAATDLKVPVDLAALPVYSRDRTFEGFRGFGVARMNETVTDPEALGLALVPGAPAGAENTEAEAPPVEAETKSADAEVSPPPAETAETPAAPRHDPFRGEIPALVIDNTPERRFSDKVIRLAEHRPPTVERSLTPVERSAFREIGDRLKKESGVAPLPPKPIEPEAAPEVISETPSPQAAAPASDLVGAARVETEEAEAAAEHEPDVAASKPAAPEEEFVTPAAEDEAEPDVTAEAEAQPIAETEEAEPETVTAEEPDALEEVSVETDEPAPTGVAEPIQPAASELAEPVEAAPAQKAPPSEPVAEDDFMPAAFPDRVPAAAIDVSILSRLPVPILIHSGDVLHYANREFLDLTGYASLGEFQREGGLGVLFADPYEADAALAGDHRMRLRTLTGEELPVEALLQSVPWNGGKALLLAVRPLHQPMPEPEPAAVRIAPVEDLHARIDELRTILDTATDGVVLIASDGTIRSISRPAEALFGLDGASVVGEPFTSLFAVESQRAARDYLSGLADNGVASVLNDGREVIGREAQGRFIPLFMTIGKLPGDSGYCAVLRDITQWKRAEEELTQARAQAERSSSQKTNFLARVSHEIRTPLNAIIGFSELMLDEKFGPIGNERYRDYLRDINRSGNHVLDLVNDLLDISKIEAGELEMSYEAVSLNDTLAETVAMMQPQANRERVIIRSSFASRLPEVVADLRSIRQIALNLLSNAIRYTQAGGQVIISTAYEASGDIVMRVRDTGIGMTQAEIEQALKPFKQINALKRGRGDGTGLGLPLTKAMVEANRARFAINSTPGEGTMVEVTFPSTRVLAD